MNPRPVDRKSNALPVVCRWLTTCRWRSVLFIGCVWSSVNHLSLYTFVALFLTRLHLSFVLRCVAFVVLFVFLFLVFVERAILTHLSSSSSFTTRQLSTFSTQRLFSSSHGCFVVCDSQAELLVSSERPRLHSLTSRRIYTTVTRPSPLGHIIFPLKLSFKLGFRPKFGLKPN